MRHPFGSVSLNAVCALMSAEMPPMRVLHTHFGGVFLIDVFMILPFENSEVEIAGIEPVTYRLRTYRSTN